MKVLVTTSPFGDPVRQPLDLLKDAGIVPVLNKVGRKYKEEELNKILIAKNPDIIIAGTERYDYRELDLAPNLKMISRVGIGFDAVDLEECKKRGIIVTITPDAPTIAVAELTICQMINMLRRVPDVHNDMMQKGWNRYVGREIKNCKIGIIGFGRIGKAVYKRLLPFEPKGLLVNDIDEGKYSGIDYSHIASMEKILTESDIITIHVPYNKENNNFISNHEFSMMKKDACLINMSRGGIVDEYHLYWWLEKNKKTFAAIDTFATEPYESNLDNIGCDLRKRPNIFMTPHMGSCTRRSRYGMEVGAAEEVIRFINEEDFRNRIA